MQLVKNIIQYCLKYIDTYICIFKLSNKFKKIDQNSAKNLSNIISHMMTISSINQEDIAKIEDLYIIQDINKFLISIKNLSIENQRKYIRIIINILITIFGEDIIDLNINNSFEAECFFVKEDDFNSIFLCNDELSNAHAKFFYYLKEIYLYKIKDNLVKNNYDIYNYIEYIKCITKILMINSIFSQFNNKYSIKL